MNAEKDTKPFAIRGISVSKIGPFARVTINFPPIYIKGKAEIHILTGENGLGKSTVLMLLSHFYPQENLYLKKRFWNSKSYYNLEFTDAQIGRYSIRHFEETTIRKGQGNLIRSGSKFKDYDVFDTVPKDIIEYVSQDYKSPHHLAFFAYSGYRKLSNSTVESISEPTFNPFQNALDFDKSTDTKTFVNWLSNTTGFSYKTSC